MRPRVVQSGVHSVASATSRDRTLCNDWISSGSPVFRSTKRIVGRDAASAMPSASLSRSSTPSHRGGHILATSAGRHVLARRKSGQDGERRNTLATHVGILLANSMRVCRLIVRRTITTPLSSTPTTLQLFFPMSMPRIEIVVDRLLFLQGRNIIPDVLGRAGHPIINGRDSSWTIDPNLQSERFVPKCIRWHR